MRDDGILAEQRAIPATLDAWAAAPDSVAWPAPFVDIVAPLADVYRRYLDAASAIDDADARSVVLLGRRAMPVMALVQFALWTAAAQRGGQRFVGHAVLDHLAGAGPLPDEALQSIGQPENRPRLQWLRRLARTSSWTPPLRLPSAMLRPDGVALTHNALLRAHLRSVSHTVRNAYESDFAPAGGGRDEAFVRRIDADALAGQMAGTLSDGLALDDDLRDRLAAAIRPVLRESCLDSADLLGQLRATRRLPRQLWSGTGSKHMSRALGIEVLRRGGEVVRCDHGGSFVLLDSPDSVALNELAVSSRFVVATPAAATSAGLVAGQARAAAFADCSLAGGPGDPGLDVGAAAFRRSTSTTGRRRVMYVSTLFYGLHQVSPPVLPAPLYADWQTRLVALLRSLPVELVCKPHPGGLRPPPEFEPTRDIAVASARFEQAVADADVLVYDFPATTTLAVGLCTDRPVVLIDHGTMRFSETHKAAIAARCRVVRAAYDDRNRPVVARETLEEAVCSGPDAVDPGYFRRLFLGAV